MLPGSASIMYSCSYLRMQHEIKRSVSAIYGRKGKRTPDYASPAIWISTTLYQRDTSGSPANICTRKNQSWIKRRYWVGRAVPRNGGTNGQRYMVQSKESQIGCWVMMVRSCDNHVFAFPFFHFSCFLFFFGFFLLYFFFFCQYNKGNK